MVEVLAVLGEAWLFCITSSWLSDDLEYH